jgi:hypothetical protein
VEGEDESCGPHWWRDFVPLLCQASFKTIQNGLEDLETTQRPNPINNNRSHDKSLTANKLQKPVARLPISVSPSFEIIGSPNPP